jgi:hypothetical protein
MKNHSKSVIENTFPIFVCIEKEPKVNSGINSERTSETHEVLSIKES